MSSVNEDRGYVPEVPQPTAYELKPPFWVNISGKIYHRPLGRAMLYTLMGTQPIMKEQSSLRIIGDDGRTTWNSTVFPKGTSFDIVSKSQIVEKPRIRKSPSGRALKGDENWAD